MATVTVTDTLAAPVAQVFAAFTDLEHAAGRVSGITKIELLTTGEFRLGTRWRETREILGAVDDAEMEVTAYEKDRGYTITHHKAGVRVDTLFSFAPHVDGTTVSITFGLGTQGLPPGLLTPVTWAIAGRVKDALARDLSDMKRSVEA